MRNCFLSSTRVSGIAAILQVTRDGVGGYLRRLRSLGLLQASDATSHLVQHRPAPLSERAHQELRYHGLHRVERQTILRSRFPAETL